MAGVATGEDGVARCPWGAGDPLLRAYHDDEWGLPVRGEQGLFERISLEAFQSGLSWRTILAKRDAFRAAFASFDPEAVAAFGARDAKRLMADAGIVRNRMKIDATIANARAVVELRDAEGLDELIWSHLPESTPRPRGTGSVPTVSDASKELARDLKRRGMRFVGPTTAHALMEAVGLLDTHLTGCHRRGCSGIFATHGGRVG